MWKRYEIPKEIFTSLQSGGNVGAISTGLEYLTQAVLS